MLGGLVERSRVGEKDTLPLRTRVSLARQAATEGRRRTRSRFDKHQNQPKPWKEVWLHAGPRPSKNHLRDVIARVSTHPARLVLELTPRQWKRLRQNPRAQAAT